MTVVDEKHSAAEGGYLADQSDGYVGEKTDTYVGEANEYIQQLFNMPAEEKAAFEKKLLRKMDLRLLPWMT